jgi:hypothetical protein
MGIGVTIQPLLQTNGGDAYPCYKCNEGLVCRNEDGKGVCNECGEVCLHNMESADPALLVTVRK